ncbi:MAG TPA: chemotaxis protein CheW [Burkholderiaceae bacterium]|nr:chemotaxis protein CheW [Burkholderiaceae bacterium]
MAKREALRELQTRLAERLAAARTHQRAAAWLAVECRGHGLLFPLQQAGEIFSLLPVLPVPHTHAWFAGVANLRGGLYGVVDLAAFLGMVGAGSEGGREQGHLVALNASLGLNCALLVDRLAGLRSAEQLHCEEPADSSKPAFAGGRWRDANGRRWQEIVLSSLAEDERFLRVAG